MSILAVDDISAGYGEADIIKNVSITVATNEVVAIVGANGSGKSTLLKTVAGVVRARKGEICLNGQRIHNLRGHEVAARGLSYVPQLQSTFPSLTVEENLRIAAEQSGGSKSGLEDIYRIFPQLLDYRKRRAGLLSGGGRQMLGIGMGLVSNPSLLVLDEPTAALSPILATMILEKIVRDIVPMNISVLIVEQRVQEVLSIADRAYVMVDGRIVKEDAARNLTDAHLIELFLGGMAA